MLATQATRLRGPPRADPLPPCSLAGSTGWTRKAGPTTWTTTHVPRRGTDPSLSPWGECEGGRVCVCVCVCVRGVCECIIHVNMFCCSFHCVYCTPTLPPSHPHPLTPSHPHTLTPSPPSVGSDGGTSEAGSTTWTTTLAAPPGRNPRWKQCDTSSSGGDKKPPACKRGTSNTNRGSSTTQRPVSAQLLVRDQGRRPLTVVLVVELPAAVLLLLLLLLVSPHLLLLLPWLQAMTAEGSLLMSGVRSCSWFCFVLIATPVCF